MRSAPDSTPICSPDSFRPPAIALDSGGVLAIGIGAATDFFCAAKAAEGASPRTVEWYRMILIRAVRRFGDPQPVDAITAADLRAWLLELRSTLAPESIAGYVRGLKAFGNWCVAEELAAAPGFQALRQPHVPRRLIAPFSDTELRSLLALADERERALVLLLFDTGLRLSELVSLRVGDLRPDATLHVVGKGAKERIVPLGTTAPLPGRIDLPTKENCRAQAEYILVPSAQANLTLIPDCVTDEQVVLLSDIASTGFSGPESGGTKIGDAVVVFAQGPIGLCATAGAKLMGASLIIGVDSDPVRLAMSRRMGADVALDFTQVDVVAEVKRLTGGGADVTVEALGTQGTFENALRCLRPGGTLSTLGVYSGKLEMPYDAFAAGLGGHRIVTTLCPGGKERMRRLIAIVKSGRFDPLPLITHRFKLDDIVEAYDLFSNRREGVLKVAIQP